MNTMPHSRNGAYLHRLLPAVYRVRDAERAEPLRALLDVVGTELDRIEDDIAGLYDNWFIETCDEWVVPYIGDLVGARPIRSVPGAGVSERAYVANTLAYRRRKGTAFVLEQLARDTTGWPARAVEFFARLVTAQHLNHVRARPTATPSVRDAARAEAAGTAFDEFAHVPEMRRAASDRGRYNLPNVGLYLWRLQAYPLARITARPLLGSAANVFAFHPAGVDTPLFSSADAETELAHLAEEHDVPAPLRRLVLAREFDAARSGATTAMRFMRAEAPALRIWVASGGAGALTEVPASSMYACDLPEAIELASPPGLAVAIDPARGRLRFPTALSIDRVLVSYAFGFPGDLGGGPYDRSDSTGQGEFLLERCDWQAGVSHTGETAAPPAHIYPDLPAAVAAWNAQPAGLTGVIAIMDNETENAGSLDVDIKEGSRLLIIAASWPRRDDFTRPFGTFVPESLRSHLIAEITVRGLAPVGSSRPGELYINGLLVEGAVFVADGNLGRLAAQHTTLRGQLAVLDGNDQLVLAIERAVVAGVSSAPPIQRLDARDSIVSLGAGSPAYAVVAASTPCTFDGCTVLGPATVQSLTASNSLFTAAVSAVRRQTGCVRFSYIAPGSATPRRYRCQPDLAIDAAIGDAALPPPAIHAIRDRVTAGMRPSFVSLTYGDAAYGQLDARCPSELRTGAEDGSEMGAWRFLQQPQRESNLRTVLQEYLRFGLEARLFHVT